MNCNVGCQFQSAYYNLITNFTCSQLIDYCQAYENWTTLDKVINDLVGIILLFAGCGGFISYILMIIVLRSPDFNGASFIYHKAIVWMELLHMFVMAEVRGHTRLIVRVTILCIEKF